MTIKPEKYQLLKRLYPEEFSALKDSISEHGVLVAVEYDENGAILDGHHRVEICDELGIEDFPKIVRYGLSEQEKRGHVRSLNLVRRHLSRPQRQGLIRAQLLDTPTISNRAIAARLGVSHVTIGSVRKRMEGRGQLVHVKKRTDTLGRSQPAHKQITVYNNPKPDRDENRGHTTGTKTRTKKEREDDFNQTPRPAIITLLEVEEFSPTVWGPACGKSAIHSVMEERGYDVELSDIRDRGACDRHGELARVEDFLKSKKREGQCPDIVENPPFNIINEFIAHAMTEHRPNKMAFLMNHAMLCGCANEDRNLWMDKHPPTRVYVFSRRLPMMHAENYTGDKSSSQMNCCWAVWELDKHGDYPAGPWWKERRVDWKKIMECAGEGDWKADE